MYLTRMERANWHTFQVLTKRSSLMRNFLRRRYGSGRGSLHMWFGVSVEDGPRNRELSIFCDAPAGVRFLSIEPLIGPIGKIDLTGIDWVIVGGESGPAARPMKTDWVRDVRDQCAAAGVAFFFKQWGRSACQIWRTKVRRKGMGSISAAVGHSTQLRPNRMVALKDYSGREQSYVKHVFLERYLEALVHKTASGIRTLFTSMGSPAHGKAPTKNFKTRRSVSRLPRFAAQKLRGGKCSATCACRLSWLNAVKQRMPGLANTRAISRRCYQDRFRRLFVGAPRHSQAPTKRRVYFLFDSRTPKGWRISLRALQPMLARPNSEVDLQFHVRFHQSSSKHQGSSGRKRVLDELHPVWRLESKDRCRRASGRWTVDARSSQGNFDRSVS